MFLSCRRRSSQRRRNIVGPGSIDSQINGAYGFEFSVYEGNSDADRRGLSTVSKKIVETGVTSYAFLLLGSSVLI